MKKKIPAGKKGKGLRKLKKVAPQVAKRMGYKKGRRACQMAKLCPRGKAAAKRKFKVYPSAYANMYASAVCSGKVTPGGKKKRKNTSASDMLQTIKIQERFDKNPVSKKTDLIGDDKLTTDFQKGGRASLRGGGICKRGMNKKARGKNS